MRNLFLAAVFMSGLLALAGCGAEEPAISTATSPKPQIEGPWRRFTSTRGGYSIDFPASPLEKDLSIPNARAFSADVRVTGASGNRYFAALSSTYLPGSVARVGPRAFLENLYQNIWAAELKNRLISKRFFQWKGKPTLEFRYRGVSTPTRQRPPEATVRWFVVGNTVYDLTVIASPTRIAAGDVSRFQNSFRLGKAPTPPKYEEEGVALDA